MIRKYGANRTVTHVITGAYDPVKGKNTVTLQTFNVPMVTFPYEIKFINNTTIKNTDLWGFFSAVAMPVLPQPGDTVLINGQTFTFGTVRPLDPGGVPVFYEIHLTQG